MAAAGYDPRRSPRFFRALASLDASPRGELFDSHPGNADRAARLEAAIPSARAFARARRARRLGLRSRAASCVRWAFDRPFWFAN